MTQWEDTGLIFELPKESMAFGLFKKRPPEPPSFEQETIIEFIDPKERGDVGCTGHKTRRRGSRPLGR